MEIKTFLIFIVIYVNLVSAWNENCNLLDTINITDGHSDKKGNFIHEGVTYTPGSFGLSHFIYEKSKKIPVDEHMRGCICLYKPCIRVCCSPVSGQCANDFSLIVSTPDDPSYVIDSSEGEYGILSGNPCEQSFKLEPEDYEYDQWTMLKNGSMLVHETVHLNDDYCLQQETDDNSSEVSTVLVVCYRELVDPRFSVYPYGMLISIIFLIITFAIYAFIPELRNLHGKCLMCYVFALALLFSFLSFVQLEETLTLDHFKMCNFIGFSLYFSVLLSFCWLTIMSYDIWRLYQRGTTKRSSEEESKTFLIYSIYGFGIPALFTLLVFLIDTTHLLPDNLLPKIATKRCWIADSRLIEAIYVYTPISIMMLINLALFLHTANKIRHAKMVVVDSAQHMRNNSAKYRFFIYLQLFILMGIFWCMESISWIFDQSLFVFYLTDFINCLQGVFIFLICVMKSRTRKLVLHRFCNRPLDTDIDSGYNESSMKTTDMI